MKKRYRISFNEILNMAVFFLAVFLLICGLVEWIYTLNHAEELPVTAEAEKTALVTESLPDSMEAGETIPLNLATKEQLMRIDGIGEAFANRIIAYREKIGGFTSLEQLKEITGIGEKRFDQWAPYFTLN